MNIVVIESKKKITYNLQIINSFQCRQFHGKSKWKKLVKLPNKKMKIFIKNLPNYWIVLCFNNSLKPVKRATSMVLIMIMIIVILYRKYRKASIMVFLYHMYLYFFTTYFRDNINVVIPGQFKLPTRYTGVKRPLHITVSVRPYVCPNVGSSDLTTCVQHSSKHISSGFAVQILR